MVRQIERQVEVFGKSASEVRQMRAEMRALAAEDQGLTEVAGRLRAANAEMNRLEAGMVGVGAASARSRGSMMQFGMQMNDIGTMAMRSEEHASEFQSLMRNPYAVFCLTKKIHY